MLFFFRGIVNQNQCVGKKRYILGFILLLNVDVVCLNLKIQL